MDDRLDGLDYRNRSRKPREEESQSELSDAPITKTESNLDMATSSGKEDKCTFYLITIKFQKQRP